VQVNNNLNNYDKTGFTSNRRLVGDAAKTMRVIYQKLNRPGKTPDPQKLEPVLLLDYLRNKLGDQFQWYIKSLSPKEVKKLLNDASKNFRWELSMLRAELFKQEHSVSNPSQKRALVNQSTQIKNYIEQFQKNNIRRNH